ncbi:MAG: Holliday junction resolvase RuvX [Candidatus Eisenbacteria bacterium]|nr:Holliday junction resolvase RuvX [Candidatus Eisenbacteria bacterium]
MTSAAHMPRGRVLGIDVGTRRTGIALSDPSRSLASPLETVSLDAAALVDHVAGLARIHEVNTIVIGVPIRPSGDAGEIGTRAQDLADRLRARLGVEVLLWNEALSSWEAEEVLRKKKHGGRKPGGRESAARRRAAAAEIDKVAAALILQDFLDESARRIAREPDERRGGDE